MIIKLWDLPSLIYACSWTSLFLWTSAWPESIPNKHAWQCQKCSYAAVYASVRHTGQNRIQSLVNLAFNTSCYQTHWFLTKQPTGSLRQCTMYFFPYRCYHLFMVASISLQCTTAGHLSHLCRFTARREEFDEGRREEFCHLGKWITKLSAKLQNPYRLHCSKKPP